MMTLRSDDKDIEFKNEYNLLADVFYKGQKFTGSLKNEREYIEYREGVVHGTNITYYASGATKSIDTFEKGKFIQGKTYFEQGQLKTESIAEPKSYKVWNINSQLVRNNNISYFNNGNIKSISSADINDDFVLKCFSRKTELVYTQLKDIRVNDQLVRKIVYDNELMLGNYFDLLICENPELTEESDRNGDHNIWMWLWEVFENDVNQYIKILNNLLRHPEIEVKKCIANIIAVHRFNHFIEEENTENSEGDSFIKKYTEFHNNRDPNRICRKINI